jgi:hypothetical protein
VTRPDDVDVAVEREPPRSAAGQLRRRAPELGARGLLPRVIGVRAQRGEVVHVQLGGQAGGVGAGGDELRGRALVARDARDADQVGGVARERVEVECGESGILHPSDPSRAWTFVQRDDLLMPR